jgi:hypothetical protein
MMEYLHVVNVGKHNPKYKDRTNVWMKLKFNVLRDHSFARLCEIDKWRFMHFIILEIETKSPVPLDNEYLKRQGFDIKTRCLTSTIRQLADSKLVEIRSEADQEQINSRVEADQEQESGSVEPKAVKTKSVTKKRKEKSRKEKIIKYVKDNPPTKEEVLNHILKYDYNIDGSYFYNLYTANGWLNANGKPIISWRGTLVTWHHRAKKKEGFVDRNDPDSKLVSL